MIILKHTPDILRYLADLISKGKTIGFVPTMGALHKGHLSLIQASISENDITVCSIFVNPTQFDEKSDLDKYPRTTEQDTEMLLKEGTDVLFLPTQTSIYPNGTEEKPEVDLAGLDKVMEGAHRDGHFAGVVQVVHRLLEIIKPTHLYMGQKDYQQFQIINRMIEVTSSKVKLVMCPIVREEDGLAMSSRNVRLTENERKKSVQLSQTLKKIKDAYPTIDPQTARKNAINYLNQIDGITVDYIEVVDARKLSPISRWDEAEHIVVCATIRIGQIRLLDNRIII